MDTPILFLCNLLKILKISKTTSYYVLDQSGKIFLSHNKEKNLFADIKEKYW